MRTSYNTLIPLVYQLNNHNSYWGAKPRYFGCGSKSSREQKFLEAKVPPMELTFLGAKVHGNESSIIPSMVNPMWRRKCYGPCMLQHALPLSIEVAVNFCACVQSELLKWIGWHLVGTRHTSSKNVHHGWFLGQWFVIVKIDINRNWLSATTEAVRLSLSDPKSY